MAETKVAHGRFFNENTMRYLMTTRRKLAIATWKAPQEGNIYGKLTVDVSETLPYIQKLKEESDEKITITHIVGKAVAMAMANTPDFNGHIAFGKYRPHKHVDMAFLVAMDEGTDLGKVKLCGLETKNVVQIAREMREKAIALRKREDVAFEKSKPLLKLLPTWLIRPILQATGYLTGAWGFSVPALGLEAFPFGSCVITSVGMMGIDEGYAPPISFAHIPALIAITQIKDRVVVENGEIKIRPMLDLMATLDHRYLDGYQGAILAREIRARIEEPWLLDVPGRVGKDLEGMRQNMNSMNAKGSKNDKEQLQTLS